MRDPCLIYYEPGVCARCKFGSYRVFTENNVYCGLIDHQNYTEDDETVSCIITKEHRNMYLINDNDVYELNNHFFNTTLATEERICVTKEAGLSYYDGCAISGYFYDDESWLSLFTVEIRDRA